MYLYNTLTKKKELFEPINNKEVKMYSCGPTVYSYAHIGNFRTYIFVDSLRRVLKYNRFKMNHVMNITDVGHLTSDADTGEDKMEKAARKEGKNPYEIAKFYTDAFMKDMKKLNIDMPEIITKATDNIPQMLEMVQEIVDNGYGYETSTGIYFDVSKLDKYPVLSNNSVEGQEAGARIEVDNEKRNPYDFAVWIKAPENHIMKWDSPWGKSYPGWHIECSAMGRRFLGENFDIHTGGVDHIPIHHENEIAQCKGSFGHNPANFWMHCEFLLVDGGKMSKSLGNVYTLDELQEKGIEPIAYKLFCFSSHYRNKLNFTFEGAKASQISLNRLRQGYQNHKNGNQDIESSVISEYEERFHRAINDDLNMPAAMGIVWEVVRYETKSPKLAELLLKFDEVLGLEINQIPENNRELPDEIIKLIEQRNIARENKNWEESDRIRDELQNRGYSVKDTKNGTEVVKGG
ncbi:MAG: cysteine--tRNA ligase [Clostridia bacterium]|nr:cysteine--tRNA ligase [Clostridia bacterium]